MQLAALHARQVKSVRGHPAQHHGNAAGPALVNPGQNLVHSARFGLLCAWDQVEILD
jgi:hypothetical protein